jgi:hypothetical protein
LQIKPFSMPALITLPSAPVGSLRSPLQAHSWTEFSTHSLLHLLPVSYCLLAWVTQHYIQKGSTLQ